MSDKKLTKEEALLKIQELKNYVSEQEKEETKPVGYQIKNRWTNEVIFTSKYTTVKEAVLEANLSGANLYGANLYGANLSGANLY